MHILVTYSSKFSMTGSGFSVLVKVFKHFRISSALRHIQAYLGVNRHIKECFWHFHNPL